MLQPFSRRRARDRSQLLLRGEKRARVQAAACCAIWLIGVVAAPLAHAEQHVRESQQYEAQLAEQARVRARAPAPLPSEADLAALSADALAWEEALYPAPPDTAEVARIYGPLVAYELQAGDEPRAADGDEAAASGHFHADGSFHADAPGHRSTAPGHSHGPRGARDHTNPFEHGHGSLAHSGVALHAAPAAAVLAAPELEHPLAAADSASCATTPAWHRPACAQSPPALG